MFRSSSGTLELDTPTRVRGERERERDDSSERAASTSQRSSLAGSSLYSSTELNSHFTRTYCALKVFWHMS